MSDPKPDSAEARLSKYSWILFLGGGATVYYGVKKGDDAENHNRRMAEIREDIDADRLKMHPAFEHLAKRSADSPANTDYYGTILLGVIMIFVGFGLSRYSNKLRKKRTGE